MNKKIISFILVFLMIFSVTGPISFAEEAVGPYAGQVIHVRVEGKDGQHFDEEITVTDEETGLDLLETAIGEANIDGTDGQYGFFINGLYNETGQPGAGYSTSWGLYTEDEGVLVSASTGISGLNIDGLDEMLLHINAVDSSYSALTFIPVLEAEQIDDETIFTVNKKVTTYGPAPDYTPTTVEESVRTGAVITIDDIDYRTDENGQIALVLEAGNYTVKVSQEGDNYPELIRRTFSITIDQSVGPYAGQVINVRVEGKDGQYFDEEITVTDEETGLDLLETAIGEANIDGTDGQYGFFINGLYNETGQSGAGYSTSWGLYTEDEGILVSASTGISGLNIDGLDEMLLHINAVDSSYSALTFIPVLEAEQIDDETIFTVNKKVTTYGPAPDYTPTTALEKVTGAVVTIDSDSYITDENGEVAVGLEAGNYVVKVYKEGELYPELVRREYNVAVGEAESINELTEELREHYSNDSTFTFREALAYHFSSEDINNDIETINQKYQIRNNPLQASDYAANIIGLLAAGENPEDYEGVNYVQTLINAQKESGVFEIGMEGGYATQTIFSILALDMAEANYNTENAINALLGFQNETTGSFGAVDDTAMCLLVLGSHKDINGVNQAIEDGIGYLKTRQSSEGGFGYSEEWPEDNIYSIAAVIQGLIAVGENPLSEEWVKNDNSILDALLSYRDSNLFGNDGANEQAFMAISDLYRGQSMYQNFEFIEAPDTPEVEYDFTLNREGNTSLQKGCEARFTINASNSSDNAEKATLIIALNKLVGSSKEMINYIFIDRTINATSTEELSGGFLIPEVGSYEIKVMLWDNFDNKQPLAEEIIIEVK